jgi:broad specificity phosphatase PhoE
MEITSIYLVRHGETDWNATGRCQGTLDVPMNATGDAQIAALAQSLHAQRFAAAYSSPLVRARRTADAVLAARGLALVVDPDLHELSYGDVQGLAPADWPGTLAERWAREPWSVTFPGGESLHDAERRVLSVISRIVSAHRGESVLVSSHGHINRLVILRALGLERPQFWEVEQHNGSVCRIDYRGDLATVATVVTASARAQAGETSHRGAE